MTGFVPRLAEARDIAPIDALLARSYPRLLKADYPPSVLVTALPIISRAQPDLILSGRYFVVQDSEGALLGAGGWSADRLRPATGEIRHLVTDHRHLRRGVARALLEAVHGQAMAQGIGRMRCKATRTALGFYAALGYRALGEIRVPLRAGITFPAVAMERGLP